METRKYEDAGTQPVEDYSSISDQPSGVEVDPAQTEDGRGASVAARSSFRLLKEVAARKSVQLVAAFVLIASVMAFIEFSGPALLDVDGYYHTRWSNTLRESFPKLPDFKALPLTTLNEHDYVDHHYLFHVMLIPFTFGDLRFGGKLAAVVFSALAMLSLFGLMVSYRLPYRWLWLLPLVASSEPFLYRMSMTRAPALSLAMIGLGTYLILKQRWVLLGLLSFAFVWFYSLFPLIFIFAAVHALTIYIAERRFELRGMIASAAGIIAGIIINPYFPKNLNLLYEHLVMKATTGSEYTLNVGVEWYPYDSWVLLMSSLLAFVLFMVGLAAFDFRKRARDIKPLFFLIVSTLLLLMLFKSRRFVEYWPPFAVTFAAFTIGPRLKRLNFAWLASTRDRVIAAIVASVIVIAAELGMLGTVIATSVDFQWGQGISDIYDKEDRQTYWPDIYRRPGNWIAENVPPGTRVFNTDWDDFPMLYFYSPRNEYIVGLDPTYLYDRDKELWNLYAEITLGRVNDPAPFIRDRFGADYVFTDNFHPDFLRIARETGDFDFVYQDRYTTVLKLLSPEEKENKRRSESEQASLGQ